MSEVPTNIVDEDHLVPVAPFNQSPKGYVSGIPANSGVSRATAARVVFIGIDARIARQGGKRISGYAKIVEADPGDVVGHQKLTVFGEP